MLASDSVVTRSLLFVPGNSPGKYLKAQATEAGALILDLEDSVARDRKDDARQNVVEMLRRQPAHQDVWVRVNALSTGRLLHDLAAVVAHRPFGIVLPKCAGRETLDPVCHYLDALETAADVPVGHLRILAIATETAASLFRMEAYAQSTRRLWGLAWGGDDLSADVGSASYRDGAGYTDPYRLARSLCLFGAAASKVKAIDTVCVSLTDAELVRKESADAFRDGFAGKLAIHPAQVAPINEAFSRSPAQLDWARRVLAAFGGKTDQGAIQVDGCMVDEPHLKIARRFLDNDAA